VRERREVNDDRIARADFIIERRAANIVLTIADDAIVAHRDALSGGLFNRRARGVPHLNFARAGFYCRARGGVSDVGEPKIVAHFSQFFWRLDAAQGREPIIYRNQFDARAFAQRQRYIRRRVAQFNSDFAIG
jgi:hypothetical protein